MEILLNTTILEMLRDRKYTFSNKYNPQNLLKNIIPTDYKTPEQYETAMENYKNELFSIPFISNKVIDTTHLPTDNHGKLVYVYIQEGNELTNPYNDNQSDRITIIKHLIQNLKLAFPEISAAKKMSEIYEYLHLIVVFNGVSKKEPIKLELEAFGTQTFEAFPKYRLRYNVTKHELQSTYIKLSKEENERYRDIYQTTYANMNAIRIDDPVNRYYHGLPNDIYHILRYKGGETWRVVLRKTMASNDKTDKKG